MNLLIQLALVTHVVGIVLWLGGLVFPAWVLIARDRDPGPARDALARVARRLGILGDAGATLAIMGGLYMLLEGNPALLRQPWMHIKLTLVAGILVLHGWSRVAAKRAATAGGRFPRLALILIGLIALGVITLAVFKVPVAS